MHRVMTALRASVARAAAKRAAAEAMRAELRARALRRQVISWRNAVVAIREARYYFLFLVLTWLRAAFVTELPISLDSLAIEVTVSARAYT